MGRWERRKDEGGGSFIFRASQQSGWWVVQRKRTPPLLPNLSPPPPRLSPVSLLSAACYYSEATFNFFSVCLHPLAPFLRARCGRQGSSAVDDEDEGCWCSCCCTCWWRSLVADQGRQGAPAMWVFCLSHIPGGGRGQSSMLGGSHRADAVRLWLPTPPPQLGPL